MTFFFLQNLKRRSKSEHKYLGWNVGVLPKEGFDEKLTPLEHLNTNFINSLLS